MVVEEMGVGGGNKFWGHSKCFIDFNSFKPKK